jgi:hypothetical protein
MCYDLNTNTLKEVTVELTNEEWNELVALKDAINYNPSSVHYEKMERFTELMVRTLEGKGDYIPR